MKKHQIKTLYLILLLGIIVSFVILITGGGFLGLDNLNKAAISLILTSVVVCITSILTLRNQYETFKKKIALWFLILFTLPLTIFGGVYVLQKTIFSIRTAIYVQNARNTNKLDYLNSKNQIKLFIDKRVNLNRELGNDEGYLIENSMVDTIFYSPNGTGKIAGILINKISLDENYFELNKDLYNISNDDMQEIRDNSKNYPYAGCVFIYSKDSDCHLFRREIGNYSTLESCIEASRELYLYTEDPYNMNSLKFWDREDDMWYKKISFLIN